MEMTGEVVSGLGRGAAYVGMDTYQERFEDVLGFSPFPGTLNIVVDEEAKEALKAAAERERIEGFEKDGERFSAVDAFPVTVETVEAALLEMEVTDHPPEVAEIVAPQNLRDELALEDGDTVTCRPR
ncbi:MAG: DUF120 domain-containing protein [Candidatus Nanohaloarchaea archaeon]|nr:DUF120 domain-containing protein [Candidatus Nanohaloarchaea archaeon]